MVRLCRNCRTKNPKYRAVCYDCGYIMSSDIADRKIMLAILNELRDLNDKRPVDGTEVRLEDPIEAIKQAYAEDRLSIHELEKELEAEV